MKYNKDNIHGIKFQYEGRGEIFLLDLLKTGDNVLWTSRKDSTHYEVDSIVKYLNEGSWVVVESPVSVTYEIF